MTVASHAQDDGDTALLRRIADEATAVTRAELAMRRLDRLLGGRAVLRARDERLVDGLRRARVGHGRR